MVSLGQPMIRSVAYGILLAFGLSLLISGIGSAVFHWPYGWQIDATDSMEPLIYPGDVVLILPQIGNPSIGEIIVYYQPQQGIYYAHEVIGYKDGGYITKGINNPYPDPWVVQNSWIRGFIPTVFGYPMKIPELGYMIKLFEGEVGERTLLILVVAGVAVSETTSRLRPKIKRRSRGPSNGQILLGFFLVALAVSMVSLSHGVVRVEGTWYVVHFEPDLSYKNVGLSFSLGTLATNQTYEFGGNVSSKFPSLFIFLSSNPSVKFANDPLIDFGGNRTENFTVTTQGVGEQSALVTEMGIPYIIPAGFAMQLAEVNPILLLLVLGAEVAGFITMVVAITLAIIQRHSIEPPLRT